MFVRIMMQHMLKMKMKLCKEMELNSNNKAKNINQMEAMVQARVAERRPALSWPSLKRAILIDEPLVRRLHCRSRASAMHMHQPQWSFPIPNGQPEAEASERPIYGVA